MREAISKASEFARPKIKGAYAFNFPAPTTNPQGEYAPSSFASPKIKDRVNPPNHSMVDFAALKKLKNIKNDNII